MKTFNQWMKEVHGLEEKGLRTALGIYPPDYGTGQYPPLYFTPMSAGAAVALTTIHKGEHPELLKDGAKVSKHKKKKAHKKAQKKKG